jgi:hypothetical protein
MAPVALPLRRRIGDGGHWGTFDTEGPQTAVQTVGSESTGSEMYDEYAVTLEPGRKAPSAPTDVVATGQVTS